MTATGQSVRSKPEAGVIKTEVVTLVVAAILVGTSATLMVLRRSGETERANDVAISRAALVDAAAAVEEYANRNDGFYTGLTGKNQAFLDEYGFEPQPRVVVSVLNATKDSYCLRAANNNLGPDDWRTATYSSTDQSISPSDAC